MYKRQSLLPSFPGTQAIKDAFEYGVKVTGVTVPVSYTHLDVYKRQGQDKGVFKYMERLPDSGDWNRYK